MIEFQVKPETLIRRVSGRWTCSVGGEIYNVHDRAAESRRASATWTAAKLVQRDDDRPEIVKERFAAYERQTKPLAEYYRTHGVLKPVDGAQSVDAVTRALNEIVKGAEGRDGHL